MDDIVTRLKTETWSGFQLLAAEAVLEIERLRDALAAMTAQRDTLYATLPDGAEIQASLAAKRNTTPNAEAVRPAVGGSEPAQG